MLVFCQLTESFIVISNQLSARPQAIPDSSKMTAHVQIVSSMNFFVLLPSEKKVISIVVLFKILICSRFMYMVGVFICSLVLFTVYLIKISTCKFLLAYFVGNLIINLEL